MNTDQWATWLEIVMASGDEQQIAQARAIVSRKIESMTQDLAVLGRLLTEIRQTRAEERRLEDALQHSGNWL